MYYLYRILPNRRLQKVVVNIGSSVHLCSPDKDAARELARITSIGSDYPLTLDTNPNLDGTVDGKQDAMLPTVHRASSV